VTREQASGLVRSLFAALGQTSEGLNSKGFGGFSLGETDLYFEHRADGVLRCSARIYRLRVAPRPQVLEAFRKVERAKSDDAGGGRFEYQPENGGIYLGRAYVDPIDPAVFVDEFKRLAQAADHWRTKVSPRIAGYVSGF
jgi:hypothetical protein